MKSSWSISLSSSSRASNTVFPWCSRAISPYYPSRLVSLLVCIYKLRVKGVVDQLRIRKKDTNSCLHGTKYINESIIQHWWKGVERQSDSLSVRLGRTRYLSSVPPPDKYGTRPFLKWVHSQGRSQHTSSITKNTFSPVGITSGARQ